MTRLWSMDVTEVVIRVATYVVEADSLEEAVDKARVGKAKERAVEETDLDTMSRAVDGDSVEEIT